MLSDFFEKYDIDTYEVLNSARIKFEIDKTKVLYDISLRRSDFVEKSFEAGTCFSAIKEWAEGRTVYVVRFGDYESAGVAANQPEFCYEKGILCNRSMGGIDES